MLRAYMYLPLFLGDSIGDSKEDMYLCGTDLKPNTDMTSHSPTVMSLGARVSGTS